MMPSNREISIGAAVNLQRILGASTGFCAGASLMGSWAASQFVSSPALTFALIAAVAWATICFQAKGFIRGRFLRSDAWSLAFFMFAMLGSDRWLVLAGILIGLSVYLICVAGAVAHPNLFLKAGDRFYTLKYPFGLVIPLSYLAPEPLSPALEPLAAIFLSPGPVTMPTWRISIFDAASLHSYLTSRAVSLSSQDLEWESIVFRFRRAVRILGLLETLGKLEPDSLDAVALAAAARLAIHAMPETARLTLIEALPSFAPVRRQTILDAFDLLPSKI
jgi:hypothetical protein